MATKLLLERWLNVHLPHSTAFISWQLGALRCSYIHKVSDDKVNVYMNFSQNFADLAHKLSAFISKI